MSWIFSKAMMESYENSRYSLAQAVEYSAENCSGGEQFAQLNVMPTPHKFWRNDKTMEFSRLSQFGLTCAILTADHGEELLTSYLAAFRAKTSASQEMAQGLTGNVADCGNKCAGSSDRLNRPMSLLKTRRCLFPEDYPGLSVTLPSCGMFRDGELSELPTPDWITSGRGCGLLPTPTATDYKGSTPYQVQRRDRKGNGLTLREWLEKFSEAGETVYPNPGFLEKMMCWPEGWTELKLSETARFHLWLQQHGEF